jgi:hypothetical protein
MNKYQYHDKLASYLSLASDVASALASKDVAKAETTHKHLSITLDRAQVVTKRKALTGGRIIEVAELQEQRFYKLSVKGNQAFVKGKIMKNNFQKLASYMALILVSALPLSADAIADYKTNPVEDPNDNKVLLMTLNRQLKDK